MRPRVRAVLPSAGEARAARGHMPVSDNPANQDASCELHRAWAEGCETAVDRAFQLLLDVFARLVINWLQVASQRLPRPTALH